MASPNLSEIVTSTLRHRSRKLWDNVSNNNALLMRMRENGNMETIDGGQNITKELEYAENSSYTRYNGYETVDITPSDIMTAAEFAWKQISVAVSISGLEELQNAGSKTRMINLLKSRIKNAERTFENGIAEDCYSDGTSNGGKQIGGLNLLVPVDPTTGTVGSINRATYTFWRSQIRSTGGGGATAANIQTEMNTLWMTTVRQRDHVDLILADANHYGLFLASLQSIQRIQSENGKMAALGFTALKYMNADVVLDGGVHYTNTGVPADTMIFLNTKYCYLVAHEKRNMVPIGGARESVNQDATVRLLGFAGNMVLTNAALQGRLTNA